MIDHTGFSGPFVFGPRPPNTFRSGQIDQIKLARPDEDFALLTDIPDMDRNGKHSVRPRTEVIAFRRSHLSLFAAGLEMGYALFCGREEDLLHSLHQHSALSSGSIKNLDFLGIVDGKEIS